MNTVLKNGIQQYKGGKNDTKRIPHETTQMVNKNKEISRRKVAFAVPFKKNKLDKKELGNILTPFFMFYVEHKTFYV